MIPPVTSDDLRAVRDGNLGSRPSKVDSLRRSKPVPAIFVQRAMEMQKFPACFRRIKRDKREKEEAIFPSRHIERFNEICAKIMSEKNVQSNIKKFLMKVLSAFL